MIDATRFNRYMPADIKVSQIKPWLIGVFEEFEDSNFVTMRIYSDIKGKDLYPIISELLANSNFAMAITNVNNYGKTVVRIAKSTAS